MPTPGANPYWRHWYEVVQQPPFRQGDILRGIVALWLSDALQVPEQNVASTDPIQVSAKWNKGDWIILDGSCDLDQRVCPQVLLARVEMATQQSLKAPDDKQFKQRLEVTRRGGYPTKFLLSDHPELTPPFALSFVDFRNHVLMPLKYLEKHAGGTILRLRAPIREQFGNWVGACVSRVGPEDVTLIPAFTSALHDAHRLQAAALESPEPPPQVAQRRRNVFVRAASATWQGISRAASATWQRISGLFKS